MKMKSTGIKVLLGFVAVLIVARLLMGNSKAETPEEFKGLSTLFAAYVEARNSDKPVLAFVTADWCEPCQQMKRDTLADKEVAQWIRENTHPVLVDSTKSNKDATALKIQSVPTFVILRERDGEFREVARLTGFAKKDAMLAWLGEHSGPVADFVHRHGRMPDEREFQRGSEGTVGQPAADATPKD